MAQVDLQLAQGWAQRREREALRSLYDRYAENVYCLGRAMLGSEAAEDVLQETFLRAAKGMGNYRGEGKFRNWLLKIARNVVYDLGRKQKKRDRDREEKRVPRSATRPDEEAVAREITEAVRQAVLGLPPKLRLAITLHHLRELPLGEVGEIMQLKEGTLKNLLFRARARLKGQLANYMDAVPAG